MEDRDKKAALDDLRNGGTVISAAAAGGVCEMTLWRARQADPAFGEAVQEAREAGRRKRAAEISKALFEGAGKCADDPRYTTQAIFALKNLAPDQFRDVHDQRLSGDLRVDHGADQATLDELHAKVIELLGAENDRAGAGK